jgi:FkbM family methyltransferase
MKAGALLGKVLPRPIAVLLRRFLGWVYYAKVVVGALLPRETAPLHEGTLDCIIATNEHGVYCVPRSCRDKYEAQRIMQSRVWEPETIELLRGLDPDGDIVHAGTFFGDFLPPLARSRRNGALVWGFEPNSESFRCAEITTMLNDLPNVVLTHAALDTKGGGKALLATNDRAGLPSGGGSHVIKDPSRVSRWVTEEVDLVSIDEVIGSERSVAVIQLDVERHEQQALTGALRTINRCRPVILVERLPEDDWFQANLAPLGYQRDGSVHVNTVFRCR